VSQNQFPILFIHCRRGLFQLTMCQTCKYQFGCENCDCNLTTYRSFEKNMQLICHQCQTQYNYPKICPSCASHDLNSMFGGIEELAETITKQYGYQVVRLDLNQEFDLESDDQSRVFVTTRVFDPGLDYSIFGNIILLQADSLLSSPDYLVTEDTHQALAQLFLAINSEAKITFDTQDPESPFFTQLARLNSDHANNISIMDWFGNFLQIETQNRLKYQLPPTQNLALLTSQNKNQSRSMDNVKMARQYLQPLIQQNGWKEVKITPIYPAKFLRRKGFFAYHLVIKYPKHFSNYFELQQLIKACASSYNLQVRLNPRHIF
jgi:primosomal protein N' (replication factor Y) (superfamily II helicase)